MHYKFGERETVAVTPPQDANPAVTTPYVDMSAHRQVCAIVSAASQPDTATLKARLVQAKDAQGTGAKDLVAEVTETNAGAAGALDITLNASAASLDVDNGYLFVAARFITSEAGGIAGAVIIGVDSRFK